MKKFVLSFSLFVSVVFSYGQVYNNYVENVINTINRDSLIQQMRNLSGEDPVTINGLETTITHRVSSWGNNLAAEYIYETLLSYGLSAEKQTYSMGGINVVGVQTGSLYPDEYYMICAHYDAVDYYCADDNASGTAAVLEAARIFSQIDFEYSIIYALWDEEEIGLVGSNNYAVEAAANGDIIHAVVNMDMISWDADGDGVVELHSSYNANSNLLADYMMEMVQVYDIAVNPVIELPGTSASDHASFWNHGYPSVLVIEEYYGGDFNPYYHTEQDRIAILNMDYFYESSKLCIGAVANMSTPDINMSSNELPNAAGLSMQLMPNPAVGFTQIRIETQQTQTAQLYLLNQLGQALNGYPVSIRLNPEQNIPISLSSLASGLYFVKVETQNGSVVQKLMVE